MKKPAEVYRRLPFYKVPVTVTPSHDVFYYTISGDMFRGSLTINGKEVQDDDLFKVAIQSYHYTNIEEYLDLKPEDIERNGKPI